jgi:hypothetical protein
MCTKSWLESLKRRNHFEDIRVNGKIYYNGSNGKREERCRLDSADSGLRPLAVFYEHRK